MKYGKDFCNSNRVICKENGEPFLPKSFTRKWARTLEKHGLRHIKLHGTRHSAISLLLSEGVPIHLVQSRASRPEDYFKCIFPCRKRYRISSSRKVQ